MSDTMIRKSGLKSGFLPIVPVAVKEKSLTRGESYQEPPEPLLKENTRAGESTARVFLNRLRLINGSRKQTCRLLSQRD